MYSLSNNNLADIIYNQIINSPIPTQSLDQNGEFNPIPKRVEILTIVLTLD